MIDYEKSYNRTTLVTNYDVFLSLNVVLNIANSADSDEMQASAALCCISSGPSLFALVPTLGFPTCKGLKELDLDFKLKNHNKLSVLDSITKFQTTRPKTTHSKFIHL